MLKRKKQATHLQSFHMPISTMVIAAANSVVAQAECCNLVSSFRGLACALQIAESNFVLFFFLMALIIKYWE